MCVCVCVCVSESMHGGRRRGWLRHRNDGSVPRRERERESHALDDAVEVGDDDRGRVQRLDRLGGRDVFLLGPAARKHAGREVGLVVDVLAPVWWCACVRVWGRGRSAGGVYVRLRAS